MGYMGYIWFKSDMGASQFAKTPFTQFNFRMKIGKQLHIFE